MSVKFRYNEYNVFHDKAHIAVGYEFSLYTTSKGIGQIEICTVLMDPGPATAPQDFVYRPNTARQPAAAWRGNMTLNESDGYLHQVLCSVC